MKNSADGLEESHLLRNASNSHSHQHMTFNDEMVCQVLIAVDWSPSYSSYKINLQHMCEELKDFVLCYLSLCEVEKKVIRRCVYYIVIETNSSKAASVNSNWDY